MKLHSIRLFTEQLIRDIRYNLHHLSIRRMEGDEVKFSMLRMYCHMLDKGMNNVNFKPGHSTGVYNQAKLIHNDISEKFANDLAFKWTGEILKRFELAQIEGTPQLLKITPPHIR